MSKKLYIIINQQLIYFVLELTLKILMVVGCWPPNSWTSLCKRTVYNIYSALLISLLFTFLLSQLMDIILNVDNTDDFTDTFYVMLAMVISCCKMIGLLVNRKNIRILTNILTQKPFIPLEADEIEIRHKFDKTIQNNTLWYTILIESTCACIVLTSLFTNFRKGNLTYREWTPHNYTSEVLFCVMYTRQLICSTVGSIVNVACDSLICGLLLHVCCQIEILECRLKKISLGQNNLRECICINGKRKIQNYYSHSICGEYAGGVLQLISIGEDDVERPMLSIDIIHMLHADTDSYLLLVWKRSEAKECSTRR
ncbi:uncharacterized protein LOC143898769 isoform X3 [Temnothorax americanus]|uniref:uncharacterized protein LOC143898769 isoform X3 n=1 Tax=Temnothorax americanus TaxID=1964332 RepID=UPI0040698549